MSTGQIGIIVYSHTGNTLSVAQKLEQALKDSGRAAVILRVEPAGDELPSAASVRIKAAPDVAPYDAVVFASPVHAFSLAPVMKLYLSQISSLTGKEVSCFVTQQLKKPWLGGNRAVRQIAAACRAKGAELKVCGVINWSSGAREEQIKDLIGKLAAR